MATTDDLPSAVEYGYAAGRYLLAVGDTTADPDRKPDSVAPVGTIKFRPLTGNVPIAGTPAVGVLPQIVTCTIDSDGDITDPAGIKGVWLIVGTYEVSFSFTGVTIPTFQMDVEATDTPDSPAWVPLEQPLIPGPTQVFVVNEAVYTETLAARDQAVDLASQALAAVGSLDDVAAAAASSAAIAGSQATAAASSASDAAAAQSAAANAAAAAAAVGATTDAQMTSINNTKTSAFAVAQLAQRDTVWLNAADHNIVSSTTLDQTPAITAMLALLPTAGGTIYLGRMTVLGSWVVKSSTRIIGMGRSRTILKAPSGSAKPVISMADNNQSGIWIENLLIDGNKGTQSLNTAPTTGSTGGNCFGILLNSFGGTGTGDHVIKNVYIQNCADDGLCIKGSNGGCYLQNVYAFTNNRYGIRIESPDNVIIGCTAGQSGSAGFYASSGNARFSQCNAYFSGRIDPSTGYGFWIRTQNRQSFVQCQAQDNMSYGFYLLTVDGILMSGCVADSNNGSSNNVGGPASSPNNCASGWGLNNVTNSVIHGVAFNRFISTAASNVPSATYRQVAPVALLAGTTSSGNQIDVQENGSHLTALSAGDGTATDMAAWGANRGHISGTCAPPGTPGTTSISANTTLTLQTVGTKDPTTGVVTQAPQSTINQLCTGATAFSVTLPTTTTPGYEFFIKNLSTAVITIVGTIDGATNYSLSARYKGVHLISTATAGQWAIKALV